MKVFSIHGKPLIATLVASFLVCAGCIEVDPLIQGGRKGCVTPMTNAVYHGCAYSGKPWGGYWTAGGDREHAVYSVRAKYNIWYALAAVCSFGLYMPMDIEWRYDLGDEKETK